MKTLLLSIIFLIPNLSSAGQCMSKAEILTLADKIISTSFIQSGQVFIEHDLQRLKNQILDKCISSTNLPFKYSAFFDFTTGEHSNSIENNRLQIWKNAYDNLTTISTYGPFNTLEFKKNKLHNAYQKFQPQLVDFTPSQILEISVKPNLECSEVDLSNEMPPIRNQRDTPWCQFYSYNDLLSHYTNKTMSASYFGFMLGPGLGSSGINNDSVNALLSNQGVCPEEVLPSNNIEIKLLKGLNSLLESLVYGEKTLNSSHLNTLKILFPQINKEILYSFIEYAKKAKDLKIFETQNTRTFKLL